MSLADELFATFPWLKRIGLTIDQMREWVIQYPDSPEAILAEARKTPAWQNMFPGLRRADGTLRTNESNYLQRDDEYRTLLKQFGRASSEYDSPMDTAAFWNQEIDPNELQQRLQTWDAIDRGSTDVKEAFYVYTGQRLTTDQLYEAAVYPEAATRLRDEYNQRVAASPLDYQTWITRATEAGLDRVTKSLGDLQNAGILTGGAISSVTATDPGFARQMMDVLYHGGDPQGGQFLSLQELLHSFEYALIGGAATANGLSAPSKEQVQALRQAGIDRAKAMEAYSAFASQKNALAGAVQRTNLGREFGQSEFEKAVLLQQAPESELLRRAQAQEKAAGESTGTAAFSQNRGALAQTGLRPL